MKSIRAYARPIASAVFRGTKHLAAIIIPGIVLLYTVLGVHYLAEGDFQNATIAFGFALYTLSTTELSAWLERNQ